MLGLFCFMPAPLTARPFSPIKFNVPVKMCAERCLKMLNVKTECNKINSNALFVAQNLCLSTEAKP